MICEKYGHNRCASCWFSKQAEVEALLAVQLEENEVKEIKARGNNTGKGVQKSQRNLRESCRQKFVPFSGFSITPPRLRKQNTVGARRAWNREWWNRLYSKEVIRRPQHA